MTGTPGIGKSYFALYELYWAIRECKNVVYQQDSTIWCFQPEEGRAFVVFEGNVAQQNEEQELLRNPPSVFLYDCCTKQPVQDRGSRAARLIVISPLNKQTYKDSLYLSGTQTYYMPVWSHDELALCYEKVYAEPELQ